MLRYSLESKLAFIGSSAFENTSLKELVFPASITSIGDRAFADCASLTRIVALSDIPSVASSAIEGCTNVSVITPYREDAAYPWSPGIAALGNHIEPYGITTTDESIFLTQDESADLFAAAEVFIPNGVSLTYAYPAMCVSVDTQGKVTAKAQGSVEVIAGLMLDDMELARGSRGVEVTAQLDTANVPNIFEQEDSLNYLSAPLPLTGSLLAMSGGEIQPRETTASGTCGTCPWDITDGVLTIKAGTLKSFVYGSVPWFSHKASITSVVIQPNVIAGSSLSCMFYSHENLTTVTGLSNLNTTNVTNMNSMFFNCSNLNTVDVSNFNTAKVADMEAVFASCLKLTTLDLSNFNTANVTNMSRMFAGSPKLTAITGLSNFNTANVTNMKGMFSSLSLLTSLDVTNFDTANVTNMESMFNSLSSLTSLDVTNFDTANVTNMRSMFHNCANFTTLDLSSFDTANITNMDGMFRFCSKLTSLDLSNFDTAKATSMSTVFGSCTVLSSVVLGSRFSKVGIELFASSAVNVYAYGAPTTVQASSNYTGTIHLMTAAASGAKNLWTSAGYTVMDDYGSAIAKGESNTCSWTIDSSGKLSIYPTNGTSGTLGGMTAAGNAPWYPHRTSITSVDIQPGVSAGSQAAYMFYGCSKVTTITGLTNLNTTDTTNMQGLFYDCVSLNDLDLPTSFNTANVINMRSMFRGCTKLTTLDLSSFSTEKVVDMGQMFYACNDLTTLDLSSFNTVKTTGTSDMFTATNQLATVKLGSTYTLPLPQKSGSNAAGVTYSGSWSDGKGKHYRYNENGTSAWATGTYTAQLAYILSFNTQQGSTAPVSQTVGVGSKANAPSPEPTKAGYTFTGWYKESTCTTKWDFDTNLMPTNNLTLYAGWKLPAIGDAFVVGPLKYTILEAGTTDATRKVSVAANDRATISGTLSIPETVPYVGTNYKVTEIGTNAFLLCSNLTGPLTIPSSVTKIGGSAFSSCTNITGALTIPSSVISIGADAFASCSKLTALTIPNSLTTLGLQAFASCTKLTSVSLGSGITSLPSNIFFNCTSLTSIASQGTITSITDKAFQGVTKSNVTISLPANASHAVWTTAGFTKFDPCQITFKSNGGTFTGEGEPTDTKIIEVKAGTPPGPAGKPVEPTRAGYNFKGWFTAASGGTEYEPNSNVTVDMTFYAQWSEANYQITFEADGGTPVPPSIPNAHYGDKLTQPQTNKAGYTLEGWYTEADFKTKWDFVNHTVTKDITLYAQWIAIIDIDVPVDPKISIDAQGNVSTGSDSTRSFVSRTPEPVLVEGVTCASTENTKLLFIDESQWQDIMITLANPNDASSEVGVSLGNTNNTTQAAFKIPEAVQGTPSELPLVFGLTLPADIKLSYADAPDGIPVAKLSYTFELLG